jgi:hypothetical protein
MRVAQVHDSRIARFAALGHRAERARPHFPELRIIELLAPPSVFFGELFDPPAVLAWRELVRRQHRKFSAQQVALGARLQLRKFVTAARAI